MTMSNEGLNEIRQEIVEANLELGAALMLLNTLKTSSMIQSESVVGLETVFDAYVTARKAVENDPTKIEQVREAVETVGQSLNVLLSELKISDDMFDELFRSVFLQLPTVRRD